MRHHHHRHQSLNREGRWGTTDDFATSFLHFSLFSTAVWDLPNSITFHARTFPGQAWKRAFMKRNRYVSLHITANFSPKPAGGPTPVSCRQCSSALTDGKLWPVAAGGDLAACAIRCLISVKQTAVYGRPFMQFFHNNFFFKPRHLNDPIFRVSLAAANFSFNFGEDFAQLPC